MQPDISFTIFCVHLIDNTQQYIPLQRMALLNPKASAVPELMFSTTLCFNFFKTALNKNKL